MNGAAASPLVSVIVPAWNAAATLEETLQSAAAQTYPNIEILIVDDGSADATAEVANRFCAMEPRARLVRQGNRGLPAARNRAIEASAGEWIAPLDADDLWHPTKIAKQVEAALAAPEPPGFVYCWYQHIDEQGQVLASSPRWAFEGAALKRLAYLNTIHTLLLSRRAVDAVGGYDHGLRACEDVMIQLQIARRFPIAVVPEHLVGYRKRAGSMSSDTGLVLQSWRSVHRRLVDEGADIPPHVIGWTESFFDHLLAESRLAEGRISEAARLMASAIRRDPGRWLPYALYRLVRTVVRRMRGRRPPADSVHFYGLDPHIYISPDPDELPRFPAMLRRREQRRLRRLAEQERLEP